MKTYYFYTLHGEFPPKSEFNYLEITKKAIKTKNGLLLRSVNNYLESNNAIRELFELDNGIDVRYLKYYGFKETSKDGYYQIIEQDNRILNNMSDKSKQLLTKNNFDLDGWHKPFKIPFANKNNIEKWLKLRCDKIPYMNTHELEVFYLDN